MPEKIEKAVLISLKPEWWELIRTHRKTLEIRRTRPQGVGLPVRVIVYVSKPVGKIVGEWLTGHFIRAENVGGLVRRSLVPLDDLIAYAKGQPVYGWTIADPVEYDTPMELSALGMDKPPQSWRHVEVDPAWP